MADREAGRTGRWHEHVKLTCRCGARFYVWRALYVTPRTDAERPRCGDCRFKA